MEEDFSSITNSSGILYFFEGIFVFISDHLPYLYTKETENLIDSLKFESLGIIPSNEIDKMSDEEVIKYLSEDGFTRVVA